MGLDVDIKITRSFALFGGVNYSSNNNQSLWGGNFGLGLFGVSKKGLAFRLDVGAKINQSIMMLIRLKMSELRALTAQRNT